MTLDKFKNKENIKNSTKQVRGEVFNQADLDLIWISGKLDAQYIDEQGKPYIIEVFNETQRNTVEFSVYDMDDNQLFWQVLPGPIRSYDSVQPNTVVLSPGDDLRNNGFNRGQYRVVYEFYRDILGSHDGNKLYVDEISPSRRELRVRPVKTANNSQNSIFNDQFKDFSDNRVKKQDFISVITSGVISITKDGLIQNKTGLAYNTLSEDLFLKLKTTTIKVITKKTTEYDKDILTIKDQNKIITFSIERIVEEVFNDTIFRGDLIIEWFMNPGFTQIASEWKRYLKSLTFADKDDYKIGNVDYYLNFGNSFTFPIINWIRDDKKYPDEPYSIVFKLYEPLPKNIKEKQQVWVSQQITQPVIEKVFVLGYEQDFEDGMVLRPANFDINIVGISGRETGYQSWTQLISTQPSTSQDIIDHFISSSDFGEISLNIDYGDYSNFVHFGSAEERLKNFKYKLESIETYEENLRKLNSYTQSLYVSQSSEGFRRKIREITNSFDGYERHLYYKSGSQYSASLISNDEYLFNKINEWPKKNNTYPYELYETTSSIAISWYNDQIEIARRYDADNIHSFKNNLPAYITINENNEDYLNFMYMIGQYFDNIYMYIKHLVNISNRDESLYEGLAKDLTYHVASSHGFDLWNGNDNVDLWRWAFGYDEYGTYHTGSVSGSGENWLPYGDVSKEVWRRILNNIPYILKTKGTERSVKALLSCYGIPTSLLTIREYGGPDPRNYENFEDKSAYIFDDFVYGINFEGSQSVSFTWDSYTSSLVPNTIEFRFASAPTRFDSSKKIGLGDAKPTQSLLATQAAPNNGGWAINLLNSGSGFGFIEFIINPAGTTDLLSIKTNKYRYYDNEFNSVMLVYTASSAGGYEFQLWHKKAVGDRIIEYSSASLSASFEVSRSFFSLSRGTIYIGGETPIVTNWGQNFTGSIQEFKLYNVPLNENTFNNHTRWPKSYNSNDPERTYHDLVLRYSFDNPKNHFLDTVVTDIKPNQTYTTPGTANEFDNKINYSVKTEEFAALTPNIGAGRFINNKIRKESNELIGNLDPRKRSELSVFDRAPVDSPLLGIYFTPLDAINNDIIATYAGIDLLGKIGDPRDRYNESYRGLNELKWQYWKKYTNRPQFNDYIRTIKQFDQSFFNQLRSLLPARSRPIVGTLIEPNILERYKVKWEKPSIEKPYYDDTIKTQTYLTQSWIYDNIEGVLNFTYTSASEYVLYEGTVYSGFYSTSSYYDDEEGYIKMIEPAEDAYTGSYSIIRVYSHISSSIGVDGITYTRVASYIGSDGKKKYSGYYDVYQINQKSSILQLRDLYYNMWYNGTLNTIETTFDGKEPVEITFTNPNKLIATDTGPSRIDVE